MDDWMTLDEIANHFGKSRATIMSWIGKGFPKPTHRRGHVRLWRRSVVESASRPLPAMQEIAPVQRDHNPAMSREIRCCPAGRSPG